MAQLTYFKNIHQIIIDNIIDAKLNIKVCVAWLTDSDIYNALLNRARKGITIEIIMSNHEWNKTEKILSYVNELINLECSIYYIANDSTLMHNKFCIIDNKIVITGSYNWTISARSNHENIVVLNNEISIKEYLVEFNKIKNYSRLKYLPILLLFDINHEIDVFNDAVKEFVCKLKQSDLLRSHGFLCIAPSKNNPLHKFSAIERLNSKHINLTKPDCLNSLIIHGLYSLNNLIKSYQHTDVNYDSPWLIVISNNNVSNLELPSNVTSELHKQINAKKINLINIVIGVENKVQLHCLHPNNRVLIMSEQKSLTNFFDWLISSINIKISNKNDKRIITAPISQAGLLLRIVE